ncbi:hypothetical protein QMK56_20355 [Pseudomonas protegens]|uniref:hypothetical protein n=1 Tax=Pseudomonas protegens TaxID=380021 RepID=UPI002A35B1C2|nr:hypothetical protein [Pseudomonas protegens]MDX9683842.1 hypothetical protein [Pseudomonas protegens]
MKMEQVEFIPTLNEYVTKHHENPEPHIKSLVDDFCEFPKAEDLSELQIEFRNQRTILHLGFRGRIDDIIIFNRYAIAQYNHNAKEIAPQFDEYDKEYGGMFTLLLAEQDESKLLHARMAFKNFDWYCEILNARTIANEGLIIHLWATIEQYVKKAILVMNKTLTDLPFKWPALVELSKLTGLDLERLSSYDLIDEIRVVNNKIKHLYTVDSQLCKYKGFSEHKGKKMSMVNYRVHEYAIGAHHFMNRLISSMGPTIRYEHNLEELA